MAQAVYMQGKPPIAMHACKTLIGRNKGTLSIVDRAHASTLSHHASLRHSLDGVVHANYLIFNYFIVRCILDLQQSVNEINHLNSQISCNKLLKQTC